MSSFSFIEVGEVLTFAKSNTRFLELIKIWHPNHLNNEKPNKEAPHNILCDEKSTWDMAKVDDVFMLSRSM